MHSTNLPVNTSLTEILRTLGKNKWKVCIVITGILAFAVILAIALAKRKQNVPYNDEPCRNNSDNNAYNRFANNHIIRSTDHVPTTIDGWQSYIVRKNLCDRWEKTKTQSFINATEEKVQEICSPAGRLYDGNLCISEGTMTVYDVEGKIKNCQVTQVSGPIERKVIVGCNNVNNICLPVHYQKDKNIPPTNLPCIQPSD